MNCEICQDKGWVPDGDYKKECSCSLRKKALDYLTPVYQSAQFARTFKTAPLDQGDFLFMDPQPKFKTIVKSYLLNTGMKYSHKTVSAYNVLQAFLTNSETRDFYAYSDVDILILFLVQDPNNKEYSRILNSLHQARQMKGKRTWVYSQNNVESQEFERLYGSEFVRNLKENFTKVGIGK